MGSGIDNVDPEIVSGFGNELGPELMSWIRILYDDPEFTKYLLLRL